MDKVIMGKSGTINKWYKKKGDKIEKGNILLDAVHNTVPFEVEALSSGYLQKIIKKEGEEVFAAEVVACIGKINEGFPFNGERLAQFSINKDILFELMYNSMVQACTVVPKDVKSALKKVLSIEQDELTKLHIISIFENLELCEKRKGLACADTGYPLYFIKIGNNVIFENGVPIIYRVAKEAVSKATREAKMRPTMVDPLKRTNPGDNIGYYIPKVEIRFDELVDGIEITAVPKGGGSEIFGTFYKMMAPADGIEGVLKFILDSVARATYGGKVCPPAVIGVGIGGTSDICMKIAKEAAVLRLIGERHPDPYIAKLEKELLTAINSLGVGPMGFNGINAALDLHIEYAATHTAALPVAFNAQCCICRRSTAKISSDGKIKYGIDNPRWSYR